MFLVLRAFHTFGRSLVRIAIVLESLRDLYQLDLSSRGIIQITPDIEDEVEIAYGSRPADD